MRAAERRRRDNPDDDHCGDCWDYLALDPEHRLVVSALVGEHSAEHATKTVVARPDQVWAELDGASGNALKVRYLAGDGTDQWLARLVSAGYANAGLSFYLSDRQGSVRGLTDNTGVLQDQISYDAFGNSSETNTAYGDSRKYAGYLFEATVGLYYARARWYDPGTGRWTTEDPDGFGAGDVNLQRYVGNGPTNGADPTGLDPAPGAKPLQAVPYSGPTTWDEYAANSVTTKRLSYSAGTLSCKEEMKSGLNAPCLLQVWTGVDRFGSDGSKPVKRADNGILMEVRQPYGPGEAQPAVRIVQML